MTLKYNLQLFADGPGGEKTEEPTAKKLSDARKEGQVAKSKEIATGVGLIAFFLILKFWIGQMGTQFLESFSDIYNRIPEVVTFWHGFMPVNDTRIIFQNMVLKCLIIMAPMLLIGMLVAFVCDVAQVKWQPTAKLLKPKFNRLNPVSGFKRIISLNSLVELVKSIAKLLVIVYICYSNLRDKLYYLENMYELSLMEGLQLMADVITDLGIQISAVFMIVAFADLIYQRRKFHKDMMMTKQEVKEEYKQQEGDPQIKGKIRAKMREASQRRMMQNLPQADVVITNPTHYAVAVKYDPEVADAPLVLAKGADYLAAKIKEIAKENKIEIVENKPLARMLYANVEVGQAVPPELYQAVAEVLAFVYHVQGKV